MFIVLLLCIMDKIENFALLATFCPPVFLSAHTLGAFISHSHRCNHTSSLTQKHFSIGFSSHLPDLGYIPAPVEPVFKQQHWQQQHRPRQVIQSKIPEEKHI